MLFDLTLLTIQLLSSKDYPRAINEADDLHQEDWSTLSDASQFLPSSQASTSSMRVPFLPSSQASISSTRSSLLGSHNNTPSSSQTSLESVSSARSIRSSVSSQRPTRQGIAALSPDIYNEARSHTQEASSASSTGVLLQALFEMHSRVNDVDSKIDFFTCADDMLIDHQLGPPCMQEGSCEEEARKTLENLEIVVRRSSDNDNIDEAFKVAGDILQEHYEQVVSVTTKTKKTTAKERLGQASGSMHQEQDTNVFDFESIPFESIITKHQRSDSGEERALQRRKSQRLEERRQQSQSERYEANGNATESLKVGDKHLGLNEVNGESRGNRRSRYEDRLADNQSRAGYSAVDAEVEGELSMNRSILLLNTESSPDLNLKLDDQSMLLTSTGSQGDLHLAEHMVSLEAVIIQERPLEVLKEQLNRSNSVQECLSSDTSSPNCPVRQADAQQRQSSFPESLHYGKDIEDSNDPPVSLSFTTSQSELHLTKSLQSLDEIRLDCLRRLEQLEGQVRFSQSGYEETSQGAFSQTESDGQQTRAQRYFESKEIQTILAERNVNRSTSHSLRRQHSFDGDDGPGYTIIYYTKHSEIRQQPELGSSQETAILID